MRNLAAALVFSVLASAAHAQGGAPATSSPAPAGGIEALLREFGLTGGPWSAKCEEPESPSNWYGRFVIENGRVTQVYSNSRQENRYEILQATKLSNERLRVRVRFTNPGSDELQTLEWVVRGSRVRTFSNISDKRGPLVVNGRVSDGETPWVSRCSKDTSAR